jgi:hypothetical protein
MGPRLSFKVVELFDKYKEDLHLHRLLDTRTRSTKVDEASCERDFRLSGRVFGPLRERMSTGVGEQLVSIPLIAMATPVTADQVLRQYVAINAKANNAKAKSNAATETLSTCPLLTTMMAMRTTMMAMTTSMRTLATPTAQLLDTTQRSRRRKRSGVWRLGSAMDTADLSHQLPNNSTSTT